MSFDTLQEQYNDSDVGMAKSGLDTALDCLETCETEADFTANLNDAKEAARWLLKELEAIS